MSNGLPLNTKLAVEHLIRTAVEDHVVVAGFAFSMDPTAIINFGNCNDAGDLKLFTELCELLAEKKSHNQVIRQPIGQVV